MAKPRVLVVDDEPQMLLIVSFALETQGFVCVTAADGAGAERAFRHHEFDLVILDVMLPDVDGVELCRKLRKASRVPILLLTALNGEDEKISGLQAGADDYVTKPFSPRELALRAQAIVRRRRGEVIQVLHNGPLTFDRASREVRVDGRLIEIGDVERRFLESLIRHVGEPVSFQALLTEVWQARDQVGGRDMIKTTAYRARRALGTDADHLIHAVRGVGYMMPKLSVQ